MQEARASRYTSCRTREILGCHGAPGWHVAPGPLLESSHRVKVQIGWNGSGPIIKRPVTCESCGQAFACELSLSGCWCSKVTLTDAARVQLRAKYSNCVCPTCLKEYGSA
jgi:hypothetical protein